MYASKLLHASRTQAREELRNQVGNLRFDLNTLIESGDKSKADKKSAQALKKDFLIKVCRPGVGPDDMFNSYGERHVSCIRFSSCPCLVNSPAQLMTAICVNTVVSSWQPDLDNWTPWLFPGFVVVTTV